MHVRVGLIPFPEPSFISRINPQQTIYVEFNMAVLW